MKTHDDTLLQINDHEHQHKLKFWLDFFLLQIEYSYTMQSPEEYYTQLETQLQKLCGDVFLVHLTLSSSGPALGIGQYPSHYIYTLRCFFEQHLLRNVLKIPPCSSDFTWCTYRIWMQRFISMSHDPEKFTMRTCNQCKLIIPMQNLMCPSSLICTVCHNTTTSVSSRSEKEHLYIIPECYSAGEIKSVIL